MKTLKFFLLAILLATTTSLVSAKTYNELALDVDNLPKLTSTLQRMVKSDFNQLDNFFDQNQIEEMNETVKLTFMVTAEKKLKVLSAECENKKASEYLTQLFNNQKIKVDDTLKQRKFKLNIKLIYKS